LAAGARCGIVVPVDQPSTRRVWARLPAGAREALEQMPATDLQTLLLSLAETRTARVRPADVLRRWREDRFVRPSSSDPRAVAAVEARLWELLPAQFAAVDLSPVVPVGTCTSVAPVSQNRIVTTMRSVEVLSDSANALAVEAADRRLRQPADGEVHLATCHRLLRAQRFGPGMSSHFRLFTLVSSGRDTGSGQTQTRLLALHLGYWQRALADLAPQFRLAVFNPAVREGLTDIPSLVEAPDREPWRGYYVDAAWRTVTRRGADLLEIGDGGLTTWTAQLMGNAKERCLVSCISTERLATVAVEPGPGPNG
jgi:hypothetical protein